MTATVIPTQRRRDVVPFQLKGSPMPHPPEHDPAPAQDRDGSIHRQRRWWPAVIGTVVLAIGASLLTPVGRHEWALSIFRQPTRYTELSFDRAWALPSTQEVGTPIRITFVVGNHEGSPLSYRYVVTSDDGVYSNVLRQSTKVVAAGASWKVSITVRPGCLLSPCRIEVTLRGHPETIDFLVTMKAP